MTNLPSGDDNVKELILELCLDVLNVKTLQQADCTQNYYCKRRRKAELEKNELLNMKRKSIFITMCFSRNIDLLFIIYYLFHDLILIRRCGQLCQTRTSIYIMLRRRKCRRD